jgi:hypothetical protein
MAPISFQASQAFQAFQALQAFQAFPALQAGHFNLTQPVGRFADRFVSLQ